MATKQTLAPLERKVFRSYWQDGMIDILAGISSILIGLGWLVDLFPITLGVPVLAITAWIGIRRKVTEPRLGHVSFSSKRRRDMIHGWIAVLSLGLVVGGNLVTRIWIGGSHSSASQWFAPAIPAMIVAAMSLSCAAALGLWRFVFYGVIFAASGLAIAEVRAEPWWGLVVGGVMVACCGGILLLRFLRTFPVPMQHPDVGG